jgi:hypothetical protein
MNGDVGLFVVPPLVICSTVFSRALRAANGSAGGCGAAAGLGDTALGLGSFFGSECLHLRRSVGELVPDGIVFDTQFIGLGDQAIRLIELTFLEGLPCLQQQVVGLSARTGRSSLSGGLDRNHPSHSRGRGSLTRRKEHGRRNDDARQHDAHFQSASPVSRKPARAKLQ